jgi:hypothetical protein
VRAQIRESLVATDLKVLEAVLRKNFVRGEIVLQVTLFSVQS